ncbi:hypothetical protein DFA_06472 [Cavenderia fasciculata]|uniref:IPT/TIG domain-containing protein n=1 Tax=Cavenderia fasciculata TaxID=261658 RepID=F4PJ36_CACFS|nr:uncharacterized protein DFA_06472 [Cavenderia fasciculata]EGG24322.1 hypothetical protein DFA_06472 [Cavenderia fasciculata]|eukprot:XP_004362173.1 hypothetical protein DFA_06472 [Cavenderia fasciculata]
MDSRELESWKWIKYQYNVDWNLNDCFDPFNLGISCQIIDGIDHLTEILKVTQLIGGHVLFDLSVQDSTVSLLTFLNIVTRDNGVVNSRGGKGVGGGDLGHLQFLHISREPTTNIIPTLFSVPTLLVLEIYTSKFIPFTNNHQTIVMNNILFPNLKSLTFEIGNGGDIDNNNNNNNKNNNSLFTSCSGLQHLYLSNIPNIDFKGSRNLVSLSLYNPTNYIPNDLSLWRNLETLIVKGRKSNKLAFIGFSDLLNTMYDSDSEMVNAPSNALLKWNTRLKNVSFANNQIFKAVDYTLENAYIDMSGNEINNSLAGFNGYCMAHTINFTNNVNLTHVSDCFYCSWPYVSSWFTNTNVSKPLNFNCPIKLDKINYVVGVGSPIVTIKGENLGFVGNEDYTIPYIPNTLVGYRMDPPLSRNEKSRLVHIPFYSDGSIAAAVPLTVVRGTPIVTNAHTMHTQDDDDCIEIQVTGEFSSEVGQLGHTVEYGDELNGYYPCHIESFNESHIACKTMPIDLPSGFHHLTVSTAQYGSSTLNLVDFNKRIDPPKITIDSIKPVCHHHRNHFLEGESVEISGSFSSLGHFNQTNINIDNVGCTIDRSSSNTNSIVCTPTRPMIASTGVKNLTIVTNHWTTSVSITVIDCTPNLVQTSSWLFVLFISLLLVFFHQFIVYYNHPDETINIYPD